MGPLIRVRVALRVHCVHSILSNCAVYEYDIYEYSAARSSQVYIKCTSIIIYIS